MAATVEDLELEEGEIAEDSNDAMTNDSNDAAPDIDPGPGPLDSAGAGSGRDGGEPQKKRKKVVRKVKRKIKVKKKVVRKKGNGNNAGVGGAHNDNNNMDPNPTVPSTTTTTTLPQNPQNPQNLQPSLWEQQILMLQELQRQQADQQTQILRAAATDEDLRIWGPVVVSQAQPVMAATTLAPTPTYPPTTQQISMHINNNNNNDNPNQTPSSPDDENGKSSYEAISKMLTLLRNSANVSDSCENTDTDQSSYQLVDSNPKPKTNEVEYALVPILIQGIDYTKYKLLSQYEPKFRNDPRLNQQT